MKTTSSIGQTITLNGMEMYEAIPGSYLWIIPNGGHGPIFGDMAELFVKTALAFLHGEWTSG